MMEHSKKCLDYYNSMFPSQNITCLGVLYNCGHSFSCMFSDEAISHNHNGSARIEMLFWTLCSLVFFLKIAGFI